MKPFYYIERKIIHTSQDERKNGKWIIDFYSIGTGKHIEEKRFLSKGKAILNIMTQKKRWKNYGWTYKLTKDNKSI